MAARCGACGQLLTGLQPFIDRDVPPPARLSCSKYAFIREMQVGESAVVSSTDGTYWGLRSAASYVQRLLPGRLYKIRCLTNGMRIWRVA